MIAPSQAAEAAARYTHTMSALATRDRFDRVRAQSAILRLVRDLEAVRQPPAAILAAVVDLLPAPAEEPVSIWAMSLRDWVRTTAGGALAGPLLDRRHGHRADVVVPRTPSV
jgi:hypothetical protein